MGDDAIAKAFTEWEASLRALEGRRYILYLDFEHIRAEPRVHIDLQAGGDSARRFGGEENNMTDASFRDFVAEMEYMWSSYDHEEMILYVISVGEVVQIKTCPKPWVNGGTPLHEHCPCGFRRGSAAFNDKEHLSDHAEAILLKRAAKLLREALTELGVPEYRGYGLALITLTRNQLAIAAARGIQRGMRICLNLAALLAALNETHPTYIGPLLDEVFTDTPFDNVESIKTLTTKVLWLTKTENWDANPPYISMSPLILFPRYSVWLSELGEGGLSRLHMRSLEQRIPLYTPETPRPRTPGETFELGTKERFRAHIALGRSPSLVDTIIDRTLRLAQPLIRHPNPAFSAGVHESMQPLIEACTASRPEGLQARLLMAHARANSAAP